MKSVSWINCDRNVFVALFIKQNPNNRTDILIFQSRSDIFYDFIHDFVKNIMVYGTHSFFFFTFISLFFFTVVVQSARIHLGWDGYG